MPKKTRQEKIIADLRRKLETTQTRSESAYGDKESPKKQTQAPAQNTFPVSISTSYIKRDLTKTLLLTIIAIGLELVLYFYLG